MVFAAGAGVLQRVAQIAAAFLFMPWLLRTLGPARFGVWGAATSLSWLNGLLDLGLGAALITTVGRAAALDRQADARQHVSGALTLGSALAVLTTIAAWLLASRADGNSMSGPYFIAAVGLALNIPLSGANSIWMALQKGHISAFWELIQTVLMVGGTLAAMRTSLDVRLYVAVVYGAAVLANAGSMTHLFWRHPGLRPNLWSNPAGAIRSVAGKGFLYFATGITGGMTYMLDNVLALQLLGPEASARMAIAMRICTSTLGFLMIVSQPLWPAFAEAAARGDLRWIRKGLMRGMGLVMAGACAAAVLLIGFGPWFFHWWLHADLGIGYDLLWAMAAWILAQALGRVPYLLLNAVGVMRFQVILCLIATSAALWLKFLWAPRLGVAGILLATAAMASLVSFPALIWRDWSWFRSFRKRPGSAPPPRNLLGVVNEPA